MDLNVAVIMKWVDRLSAPAAKSGASIARIAAVNNGMVRGAGRLNGALAGQVRATPAVGKASAAVTGALGAQGAAAAMVQKATAGATAGTQVLTSATARSAEAADSATTNVVRLAGSVDQSGSAADTAAGKFSSLERIQHRGRAATRMLRGELGKLNDTLGSLAMGSIVTQGAERAGRSIIDPLRRSVDQAAEFQRGMTGIGIMADLSQTQLGAVQANIMRSAQKLAIPVAMMQQDDMAVLNKGVYRQGADLVAASNAAARLSLLAEATGAPISGPEAGGLIATYAHTMNAPAAMLDRYNAILFRGSQIGGMRMGNVARFLPEIMGQMKERAFGNRQGFIDAVAAMQITERVTGNDDDAGRDVNDLMVSLSHMLTQKRFAKMGINISDRMAADNKRGISGLTSSITAIMEKIGANPNDPRLADKLGKFFVNQYAGQAAAAIITNQQDTKAGPGFNTFRQKIADPSGLDAYLAGIQKASSDQMASLVRLQNAQASIAISTGTVLAPAMERLAGAMGAAAKVVTDMEAKHTLLSKAIVYGVGGVGVAALGLGALGNAAMGIAAPILIARSLFGRIVPLATASAAGKLAEKVAAIGEESPAAITGVARLAGVVEGLAAIPFLPIAAGIAAVGAAIGVEAWLASKAKIAPAAQARAVSTAYGHSLSAPHKAAAAGIVAAAGRLSSAAYGHSLSTSSLRAANDLGVWSARAAAVDQHARSVSRLGVVAAVTATSLANVSAAAAATRPPPAPAALVAQQPAAREGPASKAKEVHHHHHTVIHVQGSADPHKLARELGRIQAQASRRALQDDADG